MRGLRLQIVDPWLFSLKRAARAPIVMPAVFAFADHVIQDQQTTFLSAFGSFAILVLADFGGPWRKRLAAYLGLTVAGAVLITLGTLCSRTPWLAVVAMAVLGFLILLSGVISGYFAAARIAALLTFILPVSIPAPPAAIPAQLEGWALAASVGICAVMLLWPLATRQASRGGGPRHSCPRRPGGFRAVRRSVGDRLPRRCCERRGGRVSPQLRRHALPADRTHGLHRGARLPRR